MKPDIIIRSISQLSLVVIITILMQSCLQGNSKKQIENDTGKKRPNFLFVIVDDQSPFDLKQYDPKSILETPNIDKLAAEGLVFDDARHMGATIGAVCTPSRHMIMTGRTLWNLPTIKNVKNPNYPDTLGQQTLGAIFNRAGL